jgi:hypothetical protein|eukprot:COSAG06_NODE_4108_length_4567_cov_8.686661_2_plen_98_part_00
MICLAGFVIFSYVIGTHTLFSMSVFLLGIVATEWSSIASYIRSLASESVAERCEVLTEAQEAALRAMAEAFNGSCSFTARVGVEGVFKGEASACGWK